MQLITNNPYHVLGLLSDSPQRVIERQKGKINALQRVGKDIEFTDDILAIGFPNRKNGSIERAFSQIEINQNKVFHSLFWFVNTNHLDETALGYLRTGDIDKSLDIWNKITRGKSVNEKNFGAFNNLGTLKLFYSTKFENFITESFLDAIKLKIELIKSEAFSNYCQLVADETYVINTEKVLMDLIGSIMDEHKSSNITSPKNLPALISKLDSSISSLLSENLADEPFVNIESALDQTKKNRLSYPKKGQALAKKLIISTKSDHKTLKDILGKSDPKFQLISDKLAKEILQCGVDYFQEYRDLDKDNLGSNVMKLLKYAHSIAIGIQTRERIEQNIEGLEEWISSENSRKKNEEIESELSFLVEQLENFESVTISLANVESFIKKCRPKLLTIRSVFGRDDEFYLKLSSAIVSSAQSMLVSIVNKSQDFSLPISTRTAVTGAFKQSKELLDFDMIPELNDQFQRNFETLRNMYDQYIQLSSTPFLTNSPSKTQSQTIKTSSDSHSQTNKSRPPRTQNSSNNNGLLIILGIAAILIIIAAISNSNSNSRRSSNNNYPSYSPSNSSSNYSPPASTNKTPIKPKITVSKYKGNQLNNGDSPYNSVFGSGVYDKSVNNWVQFKNGNAHDVVICLVNVYSDRTIRNEYIRAGSTFQMTNIPNGTYYIKGFYGNDWNPYKKIDGTNIKGGFDTNFSFSKSDGYGDRLSLQDNGYQYSTYEVTLYSVSNGNMSQEGISQSEFFK